MNMRDSKISGPARVSPPSMIVGGSATDAPHRLAAYAGVYPLRCSSLPSADCSQKYFAAFVVLRYECFVVAASASLSRPHHTR